MMKETGENGAVLQSGVQQGIWVVDASTSQQEDPAKQRKIEPHDDRSSTQAMTQRRVEESHASSLFREQQTEDPFRTLRSFHEKQRGERQWENTHHTSVTLHSTFEGAVGGVGVNHPKPQRVTKKHQPQDQPQMVTQSQQEINHSRQDNYLQGPHNTTTYMNLPNSMQNKICGRCGLMGHIKRMCKEEVYCKYCKIYTHSTTACRTYPVTSSRKNTPEKRSSEDIEREVCRRVQEEVQRILNDLSTNRRVANTQETSHPKQDFGQKEVTSQVNDIPKHGQNVQNLIGDYQRPPEVFDRDTRNSDKTERTGGSGDPILNQQWDEPLHVQPPMIPTAVPTLQQNLCSRLQTQAQDTAANTTSRQFETSAGGQRDRSSDQKSRDPASVTRENASTFRTCRQVEAPLNEQPESLLNRGMTDQLFRVQGNVLTPTRYRQFDQTKGKQCNCYIQPTNENSNQDGQVTTTGKRNPYTEYEKESSRNGPQECKVIRILPDEEVDFMDLVRDSVSAQARTGPKPMFVNNYFVGDNNWRTVAREMPDAT